MPYGSVYAIVNEINDGWYQLNVADQHGDKEVFGRCGVDQKLVYCGRHDARCLSAVDSWIADMISAATARARSGGTAFPT
jgi:hypothetical protein